MSSLLVPSDRPTCFVLCTSIINGNESGLYVVQTSFGSCQCDATMWMSCSHRSSPCIGLFLLAWRMPRIKHSNTIVRSMAVVGCGFKCRTCQIRPTQHQKWVYAPRASYREASDFPCWQGRLVLSLLVSMLSLCTTFPTSTSPKIV